MKAVGRSAHFVIQRYVTPLALAVTLAWVTDTPLALANTGAPVGGNQIEGPAPEPSVCLLSVQEQSPLASARSSSFGSAMTGQAVMLARGSVVEHKVDVAATGPTFPFKHARVYDSRLVQSGGTGFEIGSSDGERWMGGARPAYIRGSGANVVVYADGSVARTFTKSGSNFVAPKGYNATLVLEEAGTPDEQYRLSQLETGEEYVFNSVSSNVWAEYRGRLKEVSSREFQSASKAGVQYSYDSFGDVEQVTTATGQQWAVDYSYHTSGETDKLKMVEIRNGTKVVQKVEYTYYGNVSPANTDLGGTGDLVQVKVSRLNSDNTTYTVRYTQYRYYKSSDTSGKQHQIRMVFESDAISRINSAGNANIDTPDEILGKANNFVVVGSNLVSAYASRSYTYYTSDLSTSGNVTTPWGVENLQTKYGGSNKVEYNLNDGHGMVETETVNGGCGGCGPGGAGVTRKFYYLTGSGSGSDNSAVTHICIEDVLDSQSGPKYRCIYGLNSSGVKIREAIIENPTLGTLKAWCTSRKIDSNQLLTEERMPSAHTGVITNALMLKFLHPTGGTSGSNDTDTVNSSAGVVYYHEYNTDGYRTGTRIRKGSSTITTDRYYVSATDWGDGTANKPKWLPTKTYTYPTQTTTRSSGKQTSYTYTFWTGSGDNQLKVKTTTLPVISTGQNGSGVATVVKQYYDADGRLRWVSDGEGNISYYAQHPQTGAVGYMMVDVETDALPADITSGSTGKWIAWQNPEGGDPNAPPSGFVNADNANLELVTKTEYDDQTRVTKSTLPGGSAHYTIYQTDRTIQFPYWDGTNSLQPVTLTVFNSGGPLRETYSIKGSSTSITKSGSAPTGVTGTPARADFVSWSRNYYDQLNGRAVKTLRYHEVPPSADGTHLDNYYVTAYNYDNMGRQTLVFRTVSKDATGSLEQVNQSSYDFLGRVIKLERGTSATGHALGLDTAANTTLGTINLPTLRTVTDTFYDLADTTTPLKVGDGNVTKIKNYWGTGAGEFTGRNLHRTYRGHLRGIESFHGSSETDIGPWPVYDVDWMGRTTNQGVYNNVEPTWTNLLDYAAYVSATSSNRQVYTNTNYDDLGRVYLTKRFNAAGASELRLHNYYDRNGQRVAAAEQNGAAVEYAYDGAGRRYQTRTVRELNTTLYTSGVFQYQSPTPNPSHTAMTGADDLVIQISHDALDAAGNVTERHLYEESHDHTSDASLTNDGMDFTADDDYVRGTVYQWYDGAERLTAVANYGSGDTTAGAGTWKYVATPPARGGTPPVCARSQII